MNIIAVIWDCDKTLIDGYMQDPIFEEYNVNSNEFWNKVNETVENYIQKKIRVNRDTYYLN
jgi:FMN phosphatase YigB (HAD superfamily)